MYSGIIQSVNSLAALVQQRLDIFFGKTEAANSILPGLQMENNTLLHSFFLKEKISKEEEAIFLIALVPHLQPSFFESIIQLYLPNGGELIEIGGVKTGNHRGMMPTGETALFILAGTDLQRRLEVQQVLLDSHLIKENILSLEPVKDGEPIMSGRLLVASEWTNRIILGREVTVEFGPGFPAKRITTAMDWDDLVLNTPTQNQLNDLMLWVQHNETVLQDATLQRKIKPGYRALFYGPSGTGKTLTATLLGRQFGKEVYRIDISQMVSKYIGETEKNLEKVFAKAENKNWILFFDEADALFGKRTSVQNSHDRYANQEVSYLLQRIEDYPGLVILASNFKSNMDDAFLRRFHSIIHFPSPKPADRLRLWQKTMPAAWPPEPALNLAELSEKYDLNGAAILNVVHAATLHAAARQDTFLRQTDVLEAIRKEYRKEERSMN